LKKIECVIRPDKLEELKNSLDNLGVSGMTVSQVLGHGKQKGRKEVYRGQEYEITLLPKAKVELAVRDSLVDEVVEILCQTCRTGAIGDGKIFILPLENCVRIRTGEQGEDAL
jgi:nitrogen regulatory protein P-II 1